LLDGKKIFKCALAVILAFSLLLTPQVTVSAASKSITQLQKEQANLKKKQTEVAGRLKSLKADKANKQAYKAALDTQVSTVQNQIDVTNQQIAALDSNINEKQQEIAGKQANIKANYEQLKERMRAMYLTGEASNLEIILNSTSVIDLADKAEAIKAITKHDTNLINTLKADMESIKTQKAEIESNRKSVADAKVTLDSKQKELSGLISETQAVIKEIGANEASAKEESAKLATQRKAADAAIDNWYKEYYASHSGTSGSGGYASTGNFTWPVPGVSRITSGFGSRWGAFHKGIDISASGVYGKPIVAADSGRVIQAGWGNYGTGYGGYGNVVAIDHGNGYSTLYGHCSSVAVSAGTIVKKGQVIAYVGNSGNSTGPHLHFEIRVNGAAKNPMNWFSK
jgi:murein DD-endopeptidase MepM/ murein hydrolase activator NlpD